MQLSSEVVDEQASTSALRTCAGAPLGMNISGAQGRRTLHDAVVAVCNTLDVVLVARRAAVRIQIPLQALLRIVVYADSESAGTDQIYQVAGCLEGGRVVRAHGVHKDGGAGGRMHQGLRD